MVDYVIAVYCLYTYLMWRIILRLYDISRCDSSQSNMAAYVIAVYYLVGLRISNVVDFRSYVVLIAIMWRIML